jgi:DNA primase
LVDRGRPGKPDRRRQLDFELFGEQFTSLRAGAGAPVAMPLRWEDLGRTRSGADFDAAKVLARLRRAGADPWAALARLEQTLPRRA